jgi:hypothetical protein
MANHEMGPAELLVAAARLVERARAQMDSQTRQCKCCDFTMYRNVDQYKVWRSLAELPDKLRNSAFTIEGSTDEHGNPVNQTKNYNQ